MNKISKTKLDPCYHRVHFGVALVDEDDSICYMNPYLQKITGINKEITPNIPFQKLIVERNIRSYLESKKNFLEDTHSLLPPIRIGIKNSDSSELVFDLNMGLEKKDEKNFLILFLIPVNNGKVTINQASKKHSNLKKPSFFNDSTLNDTLL